MGMKWNMGDGVSEGSLNVSRLNKWTDQIVPRSGSGQFFSGGGTKLSNELSGGVLYVLISPRPMNVASLPVSGPVTLGAGDPYWPADYPLYHFAKSGSNCFIAVRDYAGSALSASLMPLENVDGN